jgi:hypothetical protein
MMPAKFNRKLWVKRGGYLIIESSSEAEQDKASRVTGTICAVLYEEHIKQLKKMPGVWWVCCCCCCCRWSGVAVGAADAAGIGLVLQGGSNRNCVARVSTAVAELCVSSGCAFLLTGFCALLCCAVSAGQQSLHQRSRQQQGLESICRLSAAATTRQMQQQQQTHKRKPAQVKVGQAHCMGPHTDGSVQHSVLPV